MRILYFFREFDNYMFKWQRLHIFDELLRNGIEIEVFNPLNYDSYDAANERLVSHLKVNKGLYSLFMTCVGSEYLYKDTIQEISKMEIPTLLICFDNLHTPFVHKKIASVFDLVWVTSRETKYLFEKWGCKKVVFQTYAANPYIFVPNWGKPVQSISFIGSIYGGRVNKIEQLGESNLRCDLYSDDFFNNDIIAKKSKSTNISQVEIKNVIQEIIRSMSFSIGRKVIISSLINNYFRSRSSIIKDYKCINKFPSVSFEKMLEIYSNSSLSLNITELRNTFVLKNPVHKVHLRTFEIPMCGGLQLASYTEELATYFEDGKEIVLYKTPEELISKSKFYLNPKNEKQILNMKIAARNRSLDEHTWVKRFDLIFKLLEIK